MMMNGRHLEDTLLAQLVGCDLQDHRNGLDDEHAADERQQQFLLDHHRDRSNCASESERTYVSHENFRGMGVVPKKPDGRAHHGAAKNCQLADLRHALQFEVRRKCSVAADIGEHGQRSGGDDGAADSQAIQAIGKVHRIAGSDNYQRYEGDEWQKRQRPQMRIALQASDDEVGPKLFDERHQQLGRIEAARLHGDEGDRDQNAGGNLKSYFCFAGQTQIPPIAQP